MSILQPIYLKIITSQLIYHELVGVPITCKVMKYIAHIVPIMPIKDHNVFSRKFEALQAKSIVVIFLNSAKTSL